MSDRFRTRVLNVAPTEERLERALALWLAAHDRPSGKRISSWYKHEDGSWSCEWEEPAPEWQ